MSKGNIIMFAAVDITKSNACVAHISGIANGYYNDGYSVNLFVPCPRQKVSALSLLPEIKTTYYAKFNLRLPNALKLFFGLVPLLCLKGESPKLVYTRFSLFNFLVLLISKFKFPDAIRVSEHNGLVGEEIALNKGRYYPVFIADILQLLDCYFSNKIRVVTQGISKRLVALGANKDKIFVVGNGTNISHFVLMGRQEAFIKSGLDANNSYIGFIGNLAIWQGVDMLVKAFNIIAEKHPKWELLIVGDGEEYKNLNALVEGLNLSERVVFTGTVAYEDAPAFVNCFDIAASTSTAERNADIGVETIKIRDYAATGRPILAARLPGNDVLESLNVMVCHEPDNIEDIAIQLERLINDQSAREALSRSAHSYSKSHFDWNVIAKKCLVAVNL